MTDGDTLICMECCGGGGGGYRFLIPDLNTFICLCASISLGDF
jgi:hypothetical protein